MFKSQSFLIALYILYEALLHLANISIMKITEANIWKKNKYKQTRKYDLVHRTISHLLIIIHVTVHLWNQSFHVMPKRFRHYVKWLISQIDCNIYSLHNIGDLDNLDSYSLFGSVAALSGNNPHKLFSDTTNYLPLLFFTTSGTDGHSKYGMQCSTTKWSFVKIVFLIHLCSA